MADNSRVIAGLEQAVANQSIFALGSSKKKIALKSSTDHGKCREMGQASLTSTRSLKGLTKKGSSAAGAFLGVRGQGVSASAFHVVIFLPPIRHRTHDLLGVGRRRRPCRWVDVAVAAGWVESWSRGWAGVGWVERIVIWAFVWALCTYGPTQTDACEHGPVQGRDKSHRAIHFS